MRCSADETGGCILHKNSSPTGHSKCYVNLFSFAELVSSATDVVNKTINQALHLILNDVKGEFFYPDPKIVPISSKRFPSFLHFDAEYKEKYIEWINIQDFSVNEIFAQVRDYINLWHLSDSTKFTLAVSDKTNIIPRKGARYFLNACFSKPTPSCPNPLTVARVYFTVIVPELLPKHYPVKVIYRFEGHRTQYHANGRLEVRSKDFQRYFIDSILQRKLVFYTKIFECRHPQYKLEKSISHELEAHGSHRGKVGGELSKQKLADKEGDDKDEETDEETELLSRRTMPDQEKLSIMSGAVLFKGIKD